MSYGVRCALFLRDVCAGINEVFFFLSFIYVAVTHRERNPWTNAPTVWCSQEMRAES